MWFPTTFHYNYKNTHVKRSSYSNSTIGHARFWLLLARYFRQDIERPHGCEVRREDVGRTDVKLDVPFGCWPHGNETAARSTANKNVWHVSFAIVQSGVF